MNKPGTSNAPPKTLKTTLQNAFTSKLRAATEIIQTESKSQLTENNPLYNSSRIRHQPIFNMWDDDNASQLDSSITTTGPSQNKNLN